MGARLKNVLDRRVIEGDHEGDRKMGSMLWRLGESVMRCQCTG